MLVWPLLLQKIACQLLPVACLVYEQNTDHTIQLLQYLCMTLIFMSGIYHDAPYVQCNPILPINLAKIIELLNLKKIFK